MQRWLVAILMCCAAVLGGDASLAQNPLTPYPAQRTPDSCAAWARENGLQGSSSSVNTCLHGGQSGSGSSAPPNPPVASQPIAPKAQTPPRPASLQLTKCRKMARELGMTGRPVDHYVRRCLRRNGASSSPISTESLMHSLAEKLCSEGKRMRRYLA